MTDRTEPPIGFSTQEPANPGYEPKTKSMVLWGLSGLAVMVLVVGIAYQLGNRTRTTAPAVAAGSAASPWAAPVAPGTPRP